MNPKASEFVRVPRAAYDTYKHESWAVLVAAADAQTDGLSYSANAPELNGQRRPEKMEIETDEAFTERLRVYDYAHDGAFFHQRDKPYHDRAGLFVQGW